MKSSKSEITTHESRFPNPLFNHETLNPNPNLLTMECRTGCGVCCIYISISSPIPGMLYGKPAGVRCVQLMDDFKCAIFNDPSRPEVCKGFKPDLLFCGNTTEEARKTAEWLMQK